MLALGYARQRLRSFLAEVDRIGQSEFPYPDSQQALHQVRSLFEDRLEWLGQLDEESDPDTVQQGCALSLEDLFEYLPLAGFILRSTNVRNAFEIVRPLWRLAREILEPDTNPKDQKTALLLSSEWDYSPFTYVQVPHLSDFVLIGLPASESSNPLVLPLAGHEIGHSSWVARNLYQKYRARAKTETIAKLKSTLDKYKEVFHNDDVTEDSIETDMFIMQTWSPAVDWAHSQAEETFCDFLALRLFSTSYCYAFAYLLAPGLSCARPFRYPSIKTRITNLATAAARFDVTLPSGFESQFQDLETEHGTPLHQYLLSIADSALSAMVDDLADDAIEAFTVAGEALSDSEAAQRIYERFQMAIPAEGTKGLPEILNGAWQAADDTDLWKGLPTLREERGRVLRDLVLKTIEVLDIEQTLTEGN